MSLSLKNGKVLASAASVALLATAIGIGSSQPANAASLATGSAQALTIKVGGSSQDIVSDPTSPQAAFAEDGAIITPARTLSFTRDGKTDSVNASGPTAPDISADFPSFITLGAASQAVDPDSTTVDGHGNSSTASANDLLINLGTLTKQNFINTPAAISTMQNALGISVNRKSDEELESFLGLPEGGLQVFLDDKYGPGATRLDLENDIDGRINGPVSAAVDQVLTAYGDAPSPTFRVEASATSEASSRANGASKDIATTGASEVEGQVVATYAGTGYRGEPELTIGTLPNGSTVDQNFDISFSSAEAFVRENLIDAALGAAATPTPGVPVFEQELDSIFSDEFSVVAPVLEDVLRNLLEGSNTGAFQALNRTTLTGTANAQSALTNGTEVQGLEFSLIISSSGQVFSNYPNGTISGVLATSSATANPFTEDDSDEDENGNEKEDPKGNGDKNATNGNESNNIPSRVTSGK